MIGIYRLLSVKYEKQITVTRQQLISRISVMNPLYSLMSNFHLFELLSAASNFFHLTCIEICEMAILLQRFKNFFSFTNEEIIYIIAYITKANFNAKIEIYEEKLVKRFPDFLIKYGNFLNANFAAQNISTTDIFNMYKELMEGIVTPQREIDELNENLNSIMRTGYKRKASKLDMKDEIAVNLHLKKIKKDFFGEENLDDLEV
ncbi:unnamed protein product [Blepharisma stoltei]|uniref:Uncharacterized protein n=1 Tax=Blepharisma stoltei TaxID=1481888 RepID=A0AAU9IBG3_9CILI|nr:unnamed protein product [Blepharisma stoltei]